MPRKLLLTSLLVLQFSFLAPFGQAENRQPQRQENSQSDKNNTELRSKGAPVALQIECDPSCTAKEAEDHENANYIARLFYKTIYDPLALLTGALAIATFLLVLVVLGQLRDARETAKRQLRAYVGIEDFSFDCPDLKSKIVGKRGNNDDEIPVAGKIHKNFLVVTVRNFGATPACDVTVFSYVVATDFPNRLPDDFFEKNDVDNISMADVRITLARFMLHKDQIEDSKHVIENITTVREAMKNPPLKQLFLFGRIYYRDIYDRPWRTKFCFSWEPWHPPGPRFVAYEEYNGEDQKELEEWRQ